VAALETASIHQFELEIEINAPVGRVWEALTDEIDAWWLPDFRAAGADSVVSFHARPGGALVETLPDGSGLVWYTVQMTQPGKAIYLVGHEAPDWGGPRISMLKLSLETHASGTVLKVGDTRMGRIDRDVRATEEGWRQLFGDGLKRHVEEADRSPAAAD